MVCGCIIVASLGLRSLFHLERLVEVILVFVLSVIRPVLLGEVIEELSQELSKLGDSFPRKDAEVLSLGGIEVLWSMISSTVLHS